MTRFLVGPQLLGRGGPVRMGCVRVRAIREKLAIGPDPLTNLRTSPSFRIDAPFCNVCRCCIEYKETALLLPYLCNAIKKNYSAFNYKEELFMRFDYLNKEGPSLYLYKVNKKKYIEFACFNDVPDLMISILKCYFDSNSVTPNLSDNFK